MFDVKLAQTETVMMLFAIIFFAKADLFEWF